MKIKKKAGWAAALVVLTAGQAGASGFAIGISGFYFIPVDQAFKRVYGPGPGIEAVGIIRLWRNLDLWVGADYFQKRGELTFTGEETTVRVFPVKAGLRFRIPAGRFNFHAGAGLGYFFFEEKNPIGRVTEKKIGFLAKAGCYIKIVKGLYVDGYFQYSYCSIRPLDMEADIGGMSLGLGIGYDFGLEKKEDEWKWEEVRSPEKR